jgi:mRNA interferase MazF
VNLNPTIGSEVNKVRPVLIVSNDINNKYSETISIAPITSNITRIYPFEVLLPSNISGLPKDSKVQCHQVRTISKTRIVGKTLCELDDKMMALISAALKLHLGL